MGDTEAIVSDWYILCEKLLSDKNKFIREPAEEDGIHFVDIYYRDGYQLSFWKKAKREAFNELRTQGFLRERSFGRGAGQMSGWVLSSAGRYRMRFDSEGKPISRRINNDSIITPRQLPVEGIHHVVARVSRSRKL